MRGRPILGLAVALLVAAAVAGCNRGSAAPAGGAIQTAPVERRDLDVRVEAAGTVEPVRVVEVKSKASGEILRIHVETGDQVSQGALLAEIDPRDVRNALQQAQADLEAARARLAVAESQARRTQELRQARVATQQENEASALEAADARAALVKARTNLELAGERSGDVTIRAPVVGTVIEKDVEEGQIIASASQNVSGGTTLFRMADLTQMQARALVDEIDIGQVAPGQPARVTVEAYPGRAFTGRVLKIEPQAVVEQNVTMFPVLILLDNRDGLLKPGMNAEVQVEVASRPDVVVVPNSAVTSPREAAAAARSLGLDPDALRGALAKSRPDSGAARVGWGGGGRDSTGGGTASRRRASAGGAAPPTTGSPAAGSPATGSPAAGASAGGPGADGSQSGPSGPAARPGVVFVQTPAGPEPRFVLLGLSDWDDTEVLRGLEPGQQVVLLSVAKLQQQQQQFQQRVQQRTSSPFSTGGGAGARPRSGGGGP